MLTALAIGAAFLAGFLLAHHGHMRQLPRTLASARLDRERMMSATLTALEGELKRVSAELEQAVTAERRLEPREQQARALARKAIAECPFYLMSRADHDATADWMQQQHMASGGHTFMRVCVSLEGLRELATSTPRHSGDAIVFPVYLARELLGLPRFDGTEHPPAEPVHQFMAAVPPGEPTEQQAPASSDPVPFPKPQVRHEF